MISIDIYKIYKDVFSYIKTKYKQNRKIKVKNLKHIKDIQKIKEDINFFKSNLKTIKENFDAITERFDITDKRIERDFDIHKGSFFRIEDVFKQIVKDSQDKDKKISELNKRIKRLEK